MEYKNHSGNFQAAISTELIEAVRTLSPIEEVAGETVQLRRSGVELIGRCPFHPDKRPSFYVHPGKRVFCCYGCGVGGDVFEFVRLLHHCSFRESIEFLAARAGICLDGFTPSPELSAQVSALKAEREGRVQFERFCRKRLQAVGQHYRSLARSATHAEDYLRAGESDPYLHDLAWSALERFRLFEARIEREGLADPSILRTEWEQLHEAA